MRKDSRSNFSEGIFKALVLSKALVHYCASILAHSVFIGNAMLKFCNCRTRYELFYFICLTIKQVKHNCFAQCLTCQKKKGEGGGGGLELLVSYSHP